MSALIIDDEIVHYEVLGRGRPLIFVHGWVGSWRYWIPSMQATSVAFRAYAIDLWGFGDTSKAGERYAIDAQVDLIAGFLEELGIMKVALVGHGLGAIVSLLLAQKHPESVDRILAVGFPTGPRKVNERLSQAAPTELGEWLLNSTPGSEAAQSEAAKADAVAITTSLTSMADKNLVELVNDIEIPFLMVHGQSDPAVSLPGAEDGLNGSKFVHRIVFDESGHYPMMSEPNKFNRLLNEFLSLNSTEDLQALELKEEWKRRVR
jgi:pimeloyl-ACP methyl ester carboxylesterase